eukprot:TRINITY_DN15900_c0_g1_i1.p4 TRINITY_DN15900_c0_g1~~TRINITY_DN15900_c0_g1_i1.p4  ORF type:complete len:144 (+),score=51.32 TRINITY_DN15900_c0_g1_i1:60-491(+)
MPLYVCKKTGKPRFLPHGYEGDKYVEQGKVRIPFRWGRIAAGIAGFFGMSYIYFWAVASIEQNNASFQRDLRKQQLADFKEKDEEMFHLLLSRGQLGVDSVHPIEKPLDMAEMQKHVFPDDHAHFEKQRREREAQRAQKSSSA